MIELLRRIVQEVDAAADLTAALHALVKQVRDAMHVEACTVFLLDYRRQEYTLMATDGLNVDIQGKIHLRRDEGLIGLISQTLTPLNLEDASASKHFAYYPSVGEDELHGFLGAPIIYQGKVLGVITVQQSEHKKFDETQEAFLVTLAVQVASIIAHSRNADSNSFNYDIPLLGMPSVAGVGIGCAKVVYSLADLLAVPDREISTEQIPEQEQLLAMALAETKADIHELAQRFQDKLPPEELALFDVYQRILSSESLITEIVNAIRAGNWAQGALRHVITRHMQLFAEMEDEYMRERAADIHELGQRLLAKLQSKQPNVIDYPEQTVLVGEEVTAAALVAVPTQKLAALVSQKGASYSHVAILARALGIPAVMGVSQLNLESIESKQLIVDGYHGHVYVEPSAKVLREFQTLAQEERELDADLEELRTLPAQTTDQFRVNLCVNAGLALDIHQTLDAGAEGIGLYRTEVPFMTRNNFPSEEEQCKIYRTLLKSFMPRLVVMRTLDIGGDKALPYFPIEETNPFLGWRGIRVSLEQPEIFTAQLRAMLLASEGLDNLGIMFPMISNVAQLDQALLYFRRALQEVQAQNCAIEEPQVGVMIEIPSAVYQVRELAKRVDFISVGSNDLTQYLLAVDRNNSRVAHLYQMFHPAVIRALQQIVEGCHAEHKPVSICGEMAGDPAAILLLLALEFDTLSMNPRSLLRNKWVIRNFSLAHTKQLLQEVLAMDDARYIRAHLESALEQAGMGGLIRAGRR
ncbi:MAG: phosphoenolpyruvate--protein phosphotransferase [Gammaproteobacteria bacterium]